MNTPNYGYGWQTGAGRIDRTLFDEGLRQHMCASTITWGSVSY
jgi:hypothetical protein